jgi:hypothetical protein
LVATICGKLWRRTRFVNGNQKENLRAPALNLLSRYLANESVDAQEQRRSDSRQLGNDAMGQAAVVLLKPFAPLEADNRRPEAMRWCAGYIPIADAL